MLSILKGGSMKKLTAIFLAFLFIISSCSANSIEKINYFGKANYTGGDIINITKTLENVTIVEPLLIYNSTVSFKNVTTLDELQYTKDLIKVLSSTLCLYFPASPYVPGLPYLPVVVWAEDST
ncbi:MAG: hypothetical protein AB1779_04645 [Candidatus Thermoplasmatota archaeon]